MFITWGDVVVRKDRGLEPRIKELKLLELVESDFYGCPICYA